MGPSELELELFRKECEVVELREALKAVVNEEISKCQETGLRVFSKQTRNLITKALENDN
jgi:hypothetical protein